MIDKIENLEVKHNKELRQFEARVNGSVAKIEYTQMDDRIFLTHTEVPSELGGKGVGKFLVKNTLEEVERMRMKVIPACTFVKSFIQKNSEYRRMLANGIEV